MGLSLLLSAVTLSAQTAGQFDEPGVGHSAGEQVRSIILGDSIATLDGPWKFHVGDDSRWANPGADDSGWESVDLTPSPGANDGDVGLAGYVPGVTAKGHAGYQGYAWYRIHLMTRLPAGKTLALLGPWAVDSAYQMFANGTLVGGVGDFSRSTPMAHGNRYPRIFALPAATASGGSLVIAIRVWMGPWTVAAPGSGGIHIAPAIGEHEAILAQYRLQWLKIFEGYSGDAALGLLFFLLAVMVLCLSPRDRRDHTDRWLAFALVLSGIQRGNQAFFFWWEFETIRGFAFIILAVVASLNLGAWMMAWRGWLKLHRPTWFPKGVAALTLTLMIAQLLARPWVFNAAFPRAVTAGFRSVITGARLGFLLMFAWIVYRAIRFRGREGWYALPAMLAIAVVLFASELAAVHVPGIWFPWGVGVSLGEYASVVFDALLFGLLIRRLWSSAPDPAWEPVR